MADFAERIKELMKKNNINGPEIGSRFGITKQAVSRWTCGKSVPDSKILDGLASLFEVSTDYLLGRVDNPQAQLVNVPAKAIRNLKTVTPEGIYYPDNVFIPTGAFNHIEPHLNPPGLEPPKSSTEKTNTEIIDEKIAETQQKMTPELDAIRKTLLNFFKNPDSSEAKEAVKLSLEAGIDSGKLEDYLAWNEFIESRKKPPTQ